MTYSARKIVTNHVYPPIPIREFDWSAVFDDYEPPDPIGWGRTEMEAIADLRDQCEDREDDDLVYCPRCKETYLRGAEEGCEDFDCGLRP